MHSNNLIIMKVKFRNYLENLFFSSRKASNQNGFSLIEVVFSMGIITVGIISLLSLFSYNVRSEANSKNKLIAVYLSEESIEVVRQIRDSNWFSGNDWMDGITLGNAVISVYDQNDLRKGWETKAMGGGGNKKKIYLSNGSYVQFDGAIPAGWTYTGFNRQLRIDENGNPAPVAECFGILDCVKITSSVYFKDNLIAETTAYLYDGWY